MNWGLEPQEDFWELILVWIIIVVGIVIGIGGYFQTKHTLGF